MMKLFSSLFGANAAPSPAQVQTTDPELKKVQPLAHYLALAIRQSGALTPRGEATVAEYLRDFGQMPGQPGSQAQRSAKAEADVLLDIRAAELLRAPLSPRRSLSTYADELHRNALMQKERHDAVLQMRDFCEEMSLTLVGTGDECEWCRANDGRHFGVHEDPNDLLARHCRCAPYSPATFHPAIKAFDA